MLVTALNLAIPEPVVGLVLMFLWIHFKAPMPSELGSLCEGLLKHLSLLFVPAAVGLLTYVDLLAAHWMPVFLALLISTPLSIAAGAWTLPSWPRCPANHPKVKRLKPMDRAQLWVYLAEQPLLWLTVTLIAYMIGHHAFVRSGSRAVVNPVAIAALLLAGLLVLTGTPYAEYFEGAQFVHFLLGPATIALAWPLYQNFARIRRLILPMLAALLVGSVVSVGAPLPLPTLWEPGRSLAVGRTQISDQPGRHGCGREDWRFAHFDCRIGYHNRHHRCDFGDAAVGHAAHQRLACPGHVSRCCCSWYRYGACLSGEPGRRCIRRHCDGVECPDHRLSRQFTSYPVGVLMTSITIRRPDDWHVHLRDDEMLAQVLPYTARQFARAIIMPNLKPPVVNAAMAQAYRDRILAALPEGMDFTPLMTAYLTDTTDPAELQAGFESGVLTAVKLYPANATTNSAAGVSSVDKIRGCWKSCSALACRC